MFEYKIQRAWDNYREDMGLGRILLFLAFYNTFLFFLSGTAFGTYQVRALYPALLSIAFFAMRPLVIRLDSKYKFILNIIPMLICVLLNYYLIGVLDQSVDGLVRKDELFSQFDLWLFSMPVARAFYEGLAFLGPLRSVFYDIMMMSYMSYFFLPIIGGIFYYRSLKEKLKVGRYFFSVILFFSLNFLFYLIVPVSGPQYFHAHDFGIALPLSAFGQVLWQAVNDGQTTFIDCFPSGHTGIAFLVSIWMFRIKHPARYILALTTLFIIFATLALRYHYILDLLCAFPLAYFCHRVAFFFSPVRP